MSTAPTREDLAKAIRGAYVNVPRLGPGLCRICTVPTSGPQWELCVPCSGPGANAASGGVVVLSWAPMAQAGGYSAQGYQDLREYKQPGASAAHTTRLRAMMILAFGRYSECILPEYRVRSFAVSYVPSTNGREGPHPVRTSFVSMFGENARIVEPQYVGSVGGDRNQRRVYAPGNWAIDPESVEGVERVLLIDDTWVSGGHVRSLAGAFEALGIRVRVLVLGRALDPRRGDHGSYLRSHEWAPFDSDRCPVHGEAHA